MPDTDFQRIELNLIPKKGDDPVVFYASQYETARPFIADLKWGNTEFAPGDGCWAEIDIRKNDDNLVVITDDVSIDNNEVSVILPVQAVTCIGKNLGQVKIYAADDQLIAALNFILEVQADPLAGGVTSETAIDNLTQQIEDIAQEVIGEDYYDKTEVDSLLADKADVSDLPDMSLYYTKAQVDSALTAKANTADLATVATTGDYDDLINKPTIPAAQIQSDYTQADTTAVDYIKNKPDISGMIADAILAVMPVETQTGNPCSFDTDIATALQSLTAEIVSSGGNGTPDSPIPINGYTEANITRCGVNLLDYVATSHRGITATKNSDGSLTLSGIAVGGTAFITANVEMMLDAGTYSFNVEGLVPGSVYFVYTRNGNYGGEVTTTRTITLTEPTLIGGYVAVANGTDLSTPITIKFSLVVGDTPLATYTPYNGTTFTVQFGQTVYGGVYDANRGKVKPNVYYPSYNGETITGRWLSSKDVYVEGNTPTTGAQVVCLNEYDTEIDVSELSVDTIAGVNNITSDCNGDVTASYKVSFQKYVDDQ